MEKDRGPFPFENCKTMGIILKTKDFGNYPWDFAKK